MSDILLEAQGLAVELGGHRILSDVSLKVVRGEIVTIVGPNGSGKSTLLRTIVGGVSGFEGRLVRAPNLRIGYVPQRLAIDHTLPITLARFLDLAASSRSARDAAMQRTGIEHLGLRQMIDLSGGQFQRALLARALLHRPDLLVLDEAAQGLDQPGVAQFYRLVDELRRDMGCAVLMVSHDLHVVMAASDRVICLNGHVCCEGTPTVVSAAPAYRALFGFGTEGALALYRHDHDHDHDHLHGHVHAAPEPGSRIPDPQESAR